MSTAIWLPAFVVRVMDRIESELERAWSLSTMAEASGFSAHHFQRKFRGSTGETPTAFLERIRLERAALLLLSSAASITEIAWSVGFRNPETFARRFRLHFGVTARDYRRHQLTCWTRLGYKAGRDPMRDPTPIRVVHVPGFTLAVRRSFGDDEGFAYDGGNAIWGSPLGAGSERFGVTLDWPGIADPGRVRRDWGVRVNGATPRDGWVHRSLGGGHYARLAVAGTGAVPNTAYQRLFVWSMAGRYQLRPGPIFEVFHDNEIVVHQPVTDTTGE